MDYPLENLDPERFQQLCQSLLVKEFPRVQCYPVAQPDGGRDASSLLWGGDGRKFIGFQVKYARKPQAETDPHKWLMGILEDEAPKVRELIPRGAMGYVLLTNIPGTAHLDKGAIDKLNKFLSDTLGVQSQCWWRDDISRRLDNAWDLKWMYPDILSGPDFLRIIVESGFSESRERRTAAIKAFLRAQYDMDEEVRFKQVELQNKLLDLFIDVPIAFRDQQAERSQQVTFHGIASQTLARQASGYPEPEGEPPSFLFEQGGRVYSHHDESIGAATLLLSAAMQQRMSHIVIEGAPGQGKSTIAQYVCQVHRMRLLNEVEALTSLPKEHSSASIRLPIKIDLRDFALWLGRRDPFNLESDSTPTNWNKSLDSFLAALISNQSGGTNFTTDDLLAVFKISAVLLVFDGLDEVADMTRRHEVVTEIVRGVQRLEENAAAMQAIVTSRPAAFANSPGMPHGKYPHLQLLSLNRSLIMDYAERWLLARRLEGKQGAEFRSVLKEKLDQPHLRDLARNPMQLTILLSLVLTRGASLPDKRTALYDYYIDLFFSREAEKSTLVRNRRELLIDIHRYLAWLLHSQAEKGNTGGSVRQEVLQQMVADYLAREGHDPGLAKELFTGMVERVVALVSRVEGTFEFEVQPLREYFAACHLYYTAPQSSPGKERPGSKPDRFDAIARNFYWLNVTRFYAGCYSKGELPSLVERLQVLASEAGFNVISYPRILAATLLGDWVFTQNPRSIQQLVDMILERSSVRYALAPLENRRHRPGIQNALVLPPGCGRDELIKKCFEMLRGSLPKDITLQILELLQANSESTGVIMESWLREVEVNEAENRAAWLDRGVNLGTLAEVNDDRLRGLLSEFEPALPPSVISSLFRARRLDYLQSTEKSFDEVITLILERHITAQPVRRIESPLDALSHALDAGRYAVAFRLRQPIALDENLQSRNRAAKLMWSPQLATATESYSQHRHCVDVARVAEEESRRSMLEWATDLKPWNNVIERARSVWGDRWAILNLANVAAGIRSNAVKANESPDLLDPTRPLASRVRFARLRPGAHKWWRNQLDSAKSESDILLALLVALSWSKASCLLANADVLEVMLNNLDQKSWERLVSAVRRCGSLSHAGEERAEDLQRAEVPDRVSARLAVVLSDKVSSVGSHFLYERFIKGMSTQDLTVLEVVQREALDYEKLGTFSWSPDLSSLRQCYTQGAVFAPYGYYRRRNHGDSSSMSLEIAQTVLATPNEFPGFLVNASEERCQQEVSSKVRPVANIAEEESWFESV
jgi:hypothetical protein